MLRALALRNAEFLFREMVRDDGGDAAKPRVMRVHARGVTKHAGVLEDHAALGLAAFALYELTFDRTWLERAATLGA